MKSTLKGKIGGWDAVQVRAFVKRFVEHHTVRAWLVLGEEAREGLVDTRVLEQVLGLARADEGGSIVIDDIRALRAAFFEELENVYGWRTAQK